MRSTTSNGLEKKNGSSQSRPLIGTCVKNCQIAIATIATKTCNASRVRRDISSRPRLSIALHDFALQHLPDLAMQLMKCPLELDLGDVARARQLDLPVADEARGRARRHDHDAGGERDTILYV